MDIYVIQEWDTEPITLQVMSDREEAITYAKKLAKGDSRDWYSVTRWVVNEGEKEVVYNSL